MVNGYHRWQRDITCYLGICANIHNKYIGSYYFPTCFAHIGLFKFFLKEHKTFLNNMGYKLQLYYYYESYLYKFGSFFFRNLYLHY